jgi:hypothetical protein
MSRRDSRTPPGLDAKGHVARHHFPTWLTRADTPPNLTSPGEQ